MSDWSHMCRSGRLESKVGWEMGQWTRIGRYNLPVSSEVILIAAQSDAMVMIERWGLFSRSAMIEIGLVHEAR